MRNIVVREEITEPRERIIKVVHEARGQPEEYTVKPKKKLVFFLIVWSFKSLIYVLKQVYIESEVEEYYQDKEPYYRNVKKNKDYL